MGWMPRRRLQLTNDDANLTIEIFVRTRHERSGGIIQDAHDGNVNLLLCEEFCAFVREVEGWARFRVGEYTFHVALA